MTLLHRLGLVLLFGFLLAPLIVVFLTSFSNDAYLSFPPERWGVDAYAQVFQNPAFRRGMTTSLILAAIATAIGLAFGTAAAYAIARFAFPGRDLLLSVFTAPLLLPAIILGLGLLAVFAGFGLIGTLPGLVIGHSILTLPFCVRIILTAIRGIDPAVEEAAATLGATPTRVFRRVTLPLMTPGLVSAAALAFLSSFDEVIVSLFLVGPRTTTLPIEIFHHVEHRADPQVSALSVVLILLTAGLIVLVERSFGVMRALGRNG